MVILIRSKLTFISAIGLYLAFPKYLTFMEIRIVFLSHLYTTGLKNI